MAAVAMKYDIDYYGRRETTAIYDVIVDGDPFETWVTHCPDTVDKWIRGTENWNCRRLNRLIVGLDIEWRPNTIKGQQNPVAILQLFVSRRCLIYQFLPNITVPESLKNFLKNPDYTFAGVGIKDDKQKLLRDHGVEVGKVMDLREKAVYELTDQVYKNVGLKKLAEVILRKEVDHEVLGVRMSDWEQKCLSNDQVLYAALDAYLSFAIGRQLESWYD